ncbi:pyridoxamine 5'-phosphate oxidase family protein [Mycobacterium frederiksbergense]|uniref:Pyridoxamine 5'-phosphate oxidase family protein n=1 Tax=Mycolicibacterium frederiksbergense TaxID=117567 RepID=A0A6H0SAR8_9MYCO|nr:pyridoxamine 5'-phosphate oxidase family protein [Mycolicibacterium frederiksbergense]MCV7043068.1 pyridoxamine 5'-phosphate oxidase family protein [Mycolicibacterium frederiksbergense]QIV84246.1 pyridoxamine 5'-phosphate oxidase family protein [Mycolicibacterium frederiksbergense]
MTVYHPGELAVQRRLGQSDIAARLSRMVRDEIPDAAAEFLADQPMVVLAAADDADRIWTGLVTGPPGFVHVTDEQIAVDALPVTGDPLREVLTGQTHRVGMIAVQPQTRRRMRVNGVAVPTGAGLLIQPDQVYSNCPKYISRRHIEGVVSAPDRHVRHHGDALDARAQQIIAAADTFFIGSADTEGNTDASHRGGNPGFLQVLSPTRLRWPDYRGNSMFMTLGNISANPRAGLLIPDWDTGTTLQLTGTAEIIWQSEPDAQCSIEFTVDEVLELTGVSPLRWSSAELSPANPA